MKIDPSESDSPPRTEAVFESFLELSTKDENFAIVPVNQDSDVYGRVIMQTNNSKTGNVVESECISFGVETHTMKTGNHKNIAR